MTWVMACNIARLPRWQAYYHRLRGRVNFATQHAMVREMVGFHKGDGFVPGCGVAPYPQEGAAGALMPAVSGVWPCGRQVAAPADAKWAAQKIMPMAAIRISPLPRRAFRASPSPACCQ